MNYDHVCPMIDTGGRVNKHMYIYLWEGGEGDGEEIQG